MHEQPRVLVVGNQEADLAIIQDALGPAFLLARASTGEEVLRVAPNLRPDIVLLDSQLPDSNGYDTCRRIREDPGLRYVKIIMVASRLCVEERLRAYEVGADDYLTKPFEHEELLAKIRVYLRLKSVEEVDRFKTDVITLLSHEMRTPLTTMLGPAKMLLEEDLEAAERKQLAGLIHAGSMRLHALVEKVQLLGSLWSGAWRPSAEPIDLHSLLQPTLEKVEQRCQPRGIKLTARLDSCPHVRLDSRGIDQVVNSVLDNALRYSPDGGEITFTLARGADELCIAITDQGVGIRPEFLPRVFDAFAKDDIQHHGEGHGLSMAIARQILLHHGGTIDVESEVGRGTTFRVRLPLFAEADAA